MQPVPGPSRLHAIRHLRRFRHSPLALLRETRERHGDLAEIFIGPKRFYFASHPAHAQHVLTDRLANYPKSRFVFDRILPVTGQRGLVQLEGEAWGPQRQQTNRALRPDALATYLAPIRNCTQEMLATLEDGATLDFAALMTALILRTAGLIFLDVDMQQNAPALGAAFLEANRFCGEAFRSLLPLPAFVPTPARRRLRRAQAEIARFFDELSPVSESGKLVHLLRGSPDAADHLRTFLFAGHETTATSLAWTLHLIASRPDVQVRLAEEARHADTDTLEGLRKLRYTRAVYQESLRLFPPAWILARDIRETDTLQGKTLRAGAQLLLSLRDLHRHRDFWERPDEFDPDRFTRPLAHPYAFLPFGAGPRICSGTQLAMVEAVSVLAQLFRRLRFTPTQTSVTPEAMITLHPKEGVWLRINKTY